MIAARIALFIDQPDWHQQALSRAFRDLGAELRGMRVADCAFSTREPNGIRFPDGFAPDTVLVRAIGNGSFEQITRRLGILHALRRNGLRVINDATAIERCVDKSMTSFLLRQANVPTPATWTVEGREAACAVVAAADGKTLVLKPLFGSQGRGLRLIDQPEDLPAEEQVGGIYYLQRFVSVSGADFHDHRLLVCRDKVVAAMTRRGKDWITNLHRGGEPEPYAPDPFIAHIAVEAARAVGADLAGVDMLFDRLGFPTVLEVNSMPGWRGLQTVTGFDIASRIARAVLLGE